jgi:serine/threonine kinase 16
METFIMSAFHRQNNRGTQNPILHLWFIFLSFVMSLWERCFGPVLTLDSGIQCRIGRKIAEGGFSVVFRATPVGSTAQTVAAAGGHPVHEVYALKRIRCMDSELRSACLREAKVHHALSKHNKNNLQYTMPLLGMTFTEDNTVCYMLFPFYPYSLRQEINQRIFDPLQELHDTQQNLSGLQSKQKQQLKDLLNFQPWNEAVVLRMFQHLCQAVAAMHLAGYTHRDIKVENVLLQGSNTHHLTKPVLMDFGSAGPLQRTLSTRRDVLEIPEEASQHTTLSYRPPELFSGELRTSSSSNIGDNHDDDVLDYTKCDVWMLGCTLFATLYGASPGEVEFACSTGQVRIVECTHNKVLGPLPKPAEDTPSANWYSPQIKQLLQWILTQDRHARPTLTQVLAEVNVLLQNHHHQNDIIASSTGDSSVDSDMDIESQVDISFATKSVL